MSDKAEALARAVAAHSGTDRGLELALEIGLTIDEYASARLLQTRVMKDSDWNNCRSPHGLMVDCIYLVAKRGGYDVSAVKVRNKTMTIFGVGTQPRPSAWQQAFTDLIEELL